MTECCTLSPLLDLGLGREGDCEANPTVEVMLASERSRKVMVRHD